MVSIRETQESIRVSILLRFKIKNELKKKDYARLVEFLEENPTMSIEISPNAAFEFVSISPVAVAAEGFGYRVSAEVLFEQPIGFEVYDGLKLGDEVRSWLAVNRRSFKLSKTGTNSADLEMDLNLALRMMERIVNYVSFQMGHVVDQILTINSESVGSQFDMILQKEELVKRDEKPRAFGTIHAEGSKDAKKRAGDLIPVYLERDKAYLYEDKKVFMLLPRNFVMKLLKLEGTVMLPIDQFTDSEIEVLKQFSLRQYVMTRKIGGKTYYFDLDATTRKLLVKSLMRT